MALDVHTKSRRARGASTTTATGRVALDRFEVRVEDHDVPTVGLFGSLD
ncbi:MAG: hypothetical protein ACK52I_08755 [Pseudomonadota bacterium]